MGYRKYKKIREIKIKRNKLVRGVVETVEKPIEKVSSLYRESKFKKKRNIKRTHKEIIKELYRNISMYGEVLLMCERVSHEEGYEFEVKSTEYDRYIKFTKFGKLTKRNPKEVLEYYLSIFKNDDNIKVEKTNVGDLLGEHKYLVAERHRSYEVYKIKELKNGG